MLLVLWLLRRKNAIGALILRIERWILKIECVGGGWLRRRASRLCWDYVW